ncbi:uncharacterized protein LOC115228206 isoform X2 [Argonauta hians]
MMTATTPTVDDVEIELQAPDEKPASPSPQTTMANDIERNEGTCNKCHCTCLSALIVIGLLLLVILLPLSFSYLDYYELGVVRNKITGSVSLDRVYSSGRYLIGPANQFKKFKADAHIENIRNIRVFTSDKLEVGLSGSFQYFLRLHELKFLHQKYDIYYKDKVIKEAYEAIKNVLTRFTTRSVFKERKRLETELLVGLRTTLGGVCCQKGCIQNKTDSTGCLPNCKERGTCKENDFGMFVDVRYFQLGPMDIPDALDESFLNALILSADYEREKYLQTAQLVRKETEQKIKVLENKASEISEAARSDSDLIAKTMNANASFIVENSRITGLKNLYSTLGITNADQKNKFDYLRSLQKVKDLRLSIGYNQLIAGTFPKG